MQTKKMSALETSVSTAIGYTVATAANFYILPLFGAPVSWASASWIGVIFTGISLVRGYLVRRLFNWLQWKKQKPKFTCDCGQEDWNTEARALTAAGYDAFGRVHRIYAPCDAKK